MSKPYQSQLTDAGVFIHFCPVRMSIPPDIQAKQSKPDGFPASIPEPLTNIPKKESEDVIHLD